MAGAFGFLTLIQCGERPRRYIEPRRLLTMPSHPSLHASRKCRPARRGCGLLSPPSTSLLTLRGLPKLCGGKFLGTDPVAAIFIAVKDRHKTRRSPLRRAYAPT